MAKIMIANAEVTSVMKTGTGFRCQEVWTRRDGERVTQKFVVWSDHAVAVGDTVNVSGLMSLKNEEFTNDKNELIKYTAIHVNNPKVDSPLAGIEPEKKINEAAILQTWSDEKMGQATAIDEEAPF